MRAKFAGSFVVQALVVGDEAECFACSTDSACAACGGFCVFVGLVEVNVEKEACSNDVLGGPFRVFRTQAAQFAFDVAGEFFSCDALRDGRGIEAWTVVTLFGATVRALIVFEARFSVPLLPTATIATLTIPGTTVTAAVAVPLLPTATITALTIPGTTVATVVLALSSGITALERLPRSGRRSLRCPSCDDEFATVLPY